MKNSFLPDTELIDVEGEKRGKGNASCVISRIRMELLTYLFLRRLISDTATG